MTSRERVLASINHHQPDCLPLDIGATPSSGISAVAYNNLRKALGVYNSRAKIYDVVQQVVQVDEDILDRFSADALDIGRTFNDRPEDWNPVTLTDGSRALQPSWFIPRPQGEGWEAVDKLGRVIARMPAGATFYDQTVFPYIDGYPESYDGLDLAMNQVPWQALVHSPWDHADDPGFWDTLRRKTIELRETSDRALMIVCGCNLFEWGTFLRRMDNFLMDIYTDEYEVERLLDQLMERHMATLEKVCTAVGDVADILRFGDDLGMDTAPFISPEKYRRLFKPRHAALCAYVHSHSKMKTFLHSCGSVAQLLPDLIEAGYDILNPVQTTAAGMDPERLKRDFGQDIAFWGGGCNTRSILNRGTPDEVYSHTCRMIETFLPGGGFVFNQEHNILPDVPAENILAMYRAVSRYQ